MTIRALPEKGDNLLGVACLEISTQQEAELFHKKIREVVIAADMALKSNLRQFKSGGISKEDLETKIQDIIKQSEIKLLVLAKECIENHDEVALTIAIREDSTQFSMRAFIIDKERLLN